MITLAKETAQKTAQIPAHPATPVDPHDSIPVSLPKRGIAVYLDLDNLLLRASALGLKHCRWGELPVQLILKQIENLAGSRPTLCRAYGDATLQAARRIANRDWNPGSLRHGIAVDQYVQRCLHNHGFKVIHTPSFNGKNRADIQMSLECLRRNRDNDQIDTVVIGSNDSDICPLIQELQAAGKKVIFLTVRSRGKNPAAQVMKQMANGHLVVDQQFIDHGGYHTLQLAIKCLIEEKSDTMKSVGVPLNQIQNCVESIDHQFDYTDLGYKTFGEFVKDCINSEQVLEKGRLKFRSVDKIPSSEFSDKKINNMPLCKRTLNGSIKSDSIGGDDQSPTELQPPKMPFASNVAEPEVTAVDMKLQPEQVDKARKYIIT